MHVLHVCDHLCLSSPAQLRPLLESKHFKADTSRQMPPGIPPLTPRSASRTDYAHAFTSRLIQQARSGFILN